MLIRSPVDTFFIGRHVATFVCNVLLCSHLTVFVAAMADSLATIDSPPSSSKMQDHEKISLDTDSGTCAVGWLLFEPAAKCFVFDPRPASFNDNVLWCSQLNATTVSIHSKEENEFVRMLLNEQRATQESRSPVAAEPSPARVWLGSEYLTTRTNAYRWMDGTAFDFAHWAPQHPTCADTDHLCALSMPIEGRWTYIAVTNYHSNYPHATASTNDASHSHNTTALATEVDASPSSGDSSLSSLLLNTSSIESTQLVMNEVSDRRSKGMPVLSSQICQRSIDRTVTNRPTIRSAERERSERQKQYRQVSERVERGLANLQSAIDLLRLSAVSTNQSIRRETGHRIREHERLRLLLGNQTQNVGNSLAKISAEQRQLSTQLRALAIVCAALIGALAVAAICACRSYLRLRRTYIHPHAVGALLDLNSQLSVAAAAAVNK